MKTPLRWIVRAVQTALALLSLFVVVLVAANWRDDALTPEAARLPALPAPAVSDAPNAYDALLGLDAPEDQDALAAGRRIRAAFYRQLAENPADLGDDASPRSKTISGLMGAWEPLRCHETDCVDFYLGEKARLRQFLDEQSVVRQRYRQFSQIPVFDEPPQRTIAEPRPPYFVLISAVEMRLAEAALALGEGDLQAGAGILMEQIRAHRRMLAGSSLLFTKIVGVALLRRDYAMLGDAIAHWPQLARQAELAEAWRPLDAPERDLRKVIEAKAVTQVNTVRLLVPQAAQSLKDLRPGGYVKHGLYLPHATANVFARWASEDVRNIQSDAATFEAHSAARKKELDQMTLSWTSWRLLRNPVGKLLLRALADPYEEIYKRNAYIHDLDGAIRLVALQAAVQREGVPLAQVADYVQRAGPELRNPYDGQPMRWDAAHATLSFEGRARSHPNDPPTVFSVRLK